MFHLPQIARTERRKAVLRAEFTDITTCSLLEQVIADIYSPLSQA